MWAEKEIAIIDITDKNTNAPRKSIESTTLDEETW